MSILGGTLKSMITGEPPRSAGFDMKSGHVDPTSTDFPNAEGTGLGQEREGENPHAPYDGPNKTATASVPASSLDGGDDPTRGFGTNTYAARDDNAGSNGSSYDDSLANRQYDNASSAQTGAGFGTGGAGYGTGNAYESSATSGDGAAYGSGQYRGNSGTSTLDDVRQ